MRVLFGQNPTMTETERNSEAVIVVGMNRTRLLKIMSLVNEGESDRTDEQAVEYVPCVAAMSSYEGEDGDPIRYLSSFVFHDGSPMNRFFDDEGFRESLKKIIMIGYEWKESDGDLVGKYFEAFSLAVEIKCVGPNPEFSSLREEMNYYKNLTAEEKEECSSNHDMGPMKMKQFILDAMQPSEKVNTNETATGATEREQVDAQCLESKEKDAEEAEAVTSEHEPPQERIPNFTDHDITTFACRMCRTVLLDENHLAEYHTQDKDSFKQMSGGSRCQSLFCDESVLEWLAPTGDQYNVQGKLFCPKCSIKVGHWNWAGVQISSGAWVVPAIQIPLGKIDVILPVSERRKATPMVIVAPKAF